MVHQQFVQWLLFIVQLILASYLRTVSREPLAKSINPPVGLITNPTTPLPIPLAKPKTPSCFAPDGND